MVKKSQAALEFLMTYGWAILGSMLAIGALAYFGVFNVSGFLPNRCMSSAGLDCLGKPLIENNKVVFTLVNNVGYGITLNTTNTQFATGCTSMNFCNSNETSCSSTTRSISSEDKFNVVASCTNYTSGRFKGSFTFYFQNPRSGERKMSLVDVSGKSTN